jgi:hypothetical protein
MILQCGDLERALRTPELMPDMRAHAANCPACSAELHLWAQISDTAPQLRQEWESPFLWSRIEAGLRAEERPRRVPLWRWAMAAGAVLALVGMAAMMMHPWRSPPEERALLTENTLREVQGAEAAYALSIGKLMLLAAKELEQSPSPLAAAYREKLTLLDAAIADAKSAAEQNRYNTYVRGELASLYREKQKTLEEWLKNANRN